MRTVTTSDDPQAPAQTPYLNFVDGVRTIAVISVLVFHADRLILPGGFVGVDVFFVISGFFITRLCLSERFTLRNFYLGRARRILPAYFATLIFIGLVAIVVLLPDDLVSSSRSLAAGSLLLQNFVFYRSISYFLPALQANPYLHTWSLAVEWQFYLLFPFFMQVIRGHWRLAACVCVIVSTLTISAFGAFYKPNATFYLMPFRIWEFLIGSVVAVVPATSPVLRRSGDALCLSGLAMIAISMIVFSEALPFPGATALLPCLGTAAVLAGGIGRPQGIVPRSLSHRWMQSVGQASYSIYLVHWPIFVFARYLLVQREGPILTVTLLAASIALGFLSWRWIERPFRTPGTHGMVRRGSLLGAAVAITLGMAAINVATGGFPHRFPAAVNAMSATSGDIGQFRGCLGNEPPQSLNRVRCRFGYPALSTRPSIVLWGDSLAAALADGLDELARSRGRTGAFVGTDSCPPLQGLDSAFRPSMPLCRRLQQAIPKILKPSVDLLIVHASWSSQRQRGAAAFADAVRRSFPQYGRFARHVVIVGVVPGARYAVPNAMARSQAFGLNVDLRPTPTAIAAMRKTNAFLAEQARANGYVFLNLVPYLCRNDCLPYVDGRPLYVDAGHIRATTSRDIAREFADVLIPPVR